MIDSKEQILTFLKRLKSELNLKFKVKNIGLFGSYVKNSQKETSDIDLLVEFEDDADLLHYIGLILFLEESYDKKVDVISKPTLKEELRDQVLKEVIYA